MSPFNTPPEFIQWLDAEIAQRKWSDNQLAKSAKINSGTVSRIRSGTSPGFEVCIAIASALKVPPDLVLRLAGLLPRPPGYNRKSEEMLWLFSEMVDDDQDEMLHLARLKTERRRRKHNGKQTEDVPSLFVDRRDPERADPRIGRRATDWGRK